MAAEPAVALEGVSKSFGDLVVLDGLDLSVARGEVLAIMGPSGSGKSTVLRCVNGLEPYDAGRLTVLGTAMPAGLGDATAREAAWRPLRRRIGFVFQAFHLYPHLRSVENVALAPRVVAGVPEAEARKKALALLDRVGLASKASAYPRELSGGQRQRVAIARALVNEPSILLADEPTGNLDSATSTEIMGVFAELHRQGQTVVMVTHEQDIAAHAARVITLRDGLVATDQARAA